MKRRFHWFLSFLLLLSLIFGIVSHSRLTAEAKTLGIGQAKNTIALASAPLGKITFVSDRDGNFEIYKMNSDGSSQVRLTNNPARDYHPVWSPDHSKIMFGSDRDGNNEIYVMGADGANLRRVTNSSDREYFPSWSSDGTQIRFMATDRNTNHLYTMNLDGTNKVLVYTRNDMSAPAWSPDGSKVAFVSSQALPAIYVMGRDGTNLVRLTSARTTDTEPAWSPDGSKIAFESWRDGISEIYVMNADGTNQTRLTSGPSNKQHPTWSPDGLRIAYVSNQDGDFEIFTMDRNGANQIQITKNNTTDDWPRWASYNVTEPLVSTNEATNVTNTSGRLNGNLTDLGTASLVTVSFLWGTTPGSYAHETPAQTVTSAGVFHFGLSGLTQGTTYYYRAKAAGNDTGYGEEKSFKAIRYILTISAIGKGSTDPPAGTYDYAMGAVVSISATPAAGWKFGYFDGDVGDVTNRSVTNTRITMDANKKTTAVFYQLPPYTGKIAYAAYIRLSSNINNPFWDLFIMNTDGTNVAQITHSQDYWESSPVLSPDGTLIAYTSFYYHDGQSHQIYLIHVDGSGQTQLTSGGRSYSPAWSPDGRKIVFVSERDANPEIYIMDSDGSNQIRLTNNSVVDASPSFAPDGSKIIYSSMQDSYKQIYLMNPDGTGITQLTTTPTHKTSPVWAPDGSLIAYAATGATGRPGDFLPSNIFIIRLDGTNEVQLTSETYSNSRPVWSPNSDFIIYNASYEIWWVPVTGGSQNRYIYLHEAAIDATIGQDTTTLFAVDHLKISTQSSLTLTVDPQFDTPVTVDTGELVVINASVTNYGGSRANRMVTLKANNDKIQTKEVTVDAGKSAEVVFEVRFDKPGDINIDVSGYPLLLRVLEPRPKGIPAVPSPTPQLPATIESTYTPVPANVSSTPSQNTTPPVSGKQPSRLLIWLLSGLLAATCITLWFVRHRHGNDLHHR